MKLYRYVDQRLHIVTKDVISLSISVLLLFRHYISHKITFGAPSSGGVLRSACGAFIPISTATSCLYMIHIYVTWSHHKQTCAISTEAQCLILTSLLMGMYFFKFNNPLMSGV